MHGADVVDAQAVLGHARARSAARVGARSTRRRALEVRRGSAARRADRLGLVVAPARRSRRCACCTPLGPICSGVKTPRPPPSIIAGPPMPMLLSSVRDDHVAAAEQRRVAGEAAAGDDADQRHLAAQRARSAAKLGTCRPATIGMSVSPGPAAAAFGEQHDRQLLRSARARACGRSSGGCACPACRRAPCRRRRAPRRARSSPNSAPLTVPMPVTMPSAGVLRTRSSSAAAAALRGDARARRIR